MVARATPEEYFKSVQATLTVSSFPILGIPFKVDDVECLTPYSETLMLDASKILTVYPEIECGGNRYVFDSWDDGVKSLSRTVDLKEKTSYVMHYKPAPVETEQLKEEKPKGEEKLKVEEQLEEKPLATKVLQAETTAENYMPLIITAIFVLGLTICFLAYLSKR